MIKPKQKPNNPCFSSGPCSKRPGWSSDVLKNISLGRSHRAVESLTELREVINKTKQLLNLPQGYRVGIVGGSDTGAFELAMWNFLGQRGVDVMYQEHFGKIWNTDAITQLKLDVTTISADFGKVPDTSKISPDRDLVFTLNGTTSGVCFHNLDFISPYREGLTLCDATSIIYSIPIDFTKLDITTYSWQKSLGGEAQHGIIILSPRAVERLKKYTPPWPMPKLFQITKNGNLIEEIFSGSTINTPSMMCVYDYLDALNWAFSIGGLQALYERVQKNYNVVKNFIQNTSWLENLCSYDQFRSPTSVCFTITTHEFQEKPSEEQRAFIKTIVKMLSDEGVGFDFANHKAAPPSFRIWCGPTIKHDDVSALCEWISYAYHICK